MKLGAKKGADMSEVKISSTGQGADAAALLQQFLITDEDLELVRKIGKKVEPNLSAVVEEFYVWLRVQPYFENFFSNEQRVEEVKAEQIFVVTADRVQFEPVDGVELEAAAVSSRANVADHDAPRGSLGIPVIHQRRLLHVLDDQALDDDVMATSLDVDPDASRLPATVDGHFNRRARSSKLDRSLGRSGAAEPDVGLPVDSAVDRGRVAGGHRRGGLADRPPGPAAADRVEGRRQPIVVVARRRLGAVDMKRVAHDRDLRERRPDGTGSGELSEMARRAAAENRHDQDDARVDDEKALR